MKNLSVSDQLRAQAVLAKTEGFPYELIVSPRTKTVSRPLQELVEDLPKGSAIKQFNPRTGKTETVTFKKNKVESTEKD